MTATQAIALFLIGAGTAVAGYTGYSAYHGTLPFGLSTPERGSAVESSLTARPASAPALLEARPDAADSLGPTFDIVRIEPDGVSVLAGRAAPNALVSVQANGRTVATVRAQDDGNWSIAVEKGLEAGELKLSLTAEEGEAGRRVEGQTLAMSIAAREARPAATAVASAGKAATGAAGQAGASGGARQPGLPLPVKFVYDEATFTSEGQLAAARLADFIRQQRLDTVILSGHADARGSDGYNMDLSRRRLEAIARFLRDHGFTGKLVLEPKGRSEPFTGVDRSTLPLEAAYALDRRVELHLSQ